jgi:hypothetical protein
MEQVLALGQELQQCSKKDLLQIQQKEFVYSFVSPPHMVIVVEMRLYGMIRRILRFERIPDPSPFTTAVGC